MCEEGVRTCEEGVRVCEEGVRTTQKGEGRYAQLTTTRAGNNCVQALQNLCTKNYL